MAFLWSNRFSKDVADKIQDISDDLSIDPSWLMFLAELESGLDFNRPNAYGCYGFIQFCEDFTGAGYKTINGKRYLISDIKKMTPIQQLDLVKEYLSEQERNHGRFSTFYDLYLAILWPTAIGEPDDYVIRTSTNPIFDINKNGTITVGEVKKYLDNRLMSKVPIEWHKDFKKKMFCSFIKERLSSAA